VLDISYTANDPDRAAQIANAVADAYIVDQLDAKFHANRRASNWLQERVGALRDQAAVAERAVVAFKRENNIVAVGGKLMNEQQVSDLNTQLVLARARTSETEARLNRIQSIIGADASSAKFDASVSDALSNPIITKYRQQYLDLVNREADWSTRYGRNHLAVVNLRNHIREIRDSIFAELRRLAETYKSDNEIAKQRQESVEKDLAQAVSHKSQIGRRLLYASLRARPRASVPCMITFFSAIRSPFSRSLSRSPKHGSSRGRRGHSRKVARRRRSSWLWHASAASHWAQRLDSYAK
jgi:polysaccharide biosynthesis transport protein